LPSENGLGDLVIQSALATPATPPSSFVEDDFNKYKDEIVKDPEVKIMKRINCRGATLEACATSRARWSARCSPKSSAPSELTPYKGGWCGNEVFPGAFTGRCARRPRHGRAFGNQLLEEGYRGYFDLDFLIDQDNGEVYLGELNPRVCGASPMTNHAALPMPTRRCSCSTCSSSRACRST
jgi:hypothetical protein